MIETILLPSDFSATATNAGLYAIELANQIGAKKIVVYHTYEAASVSEPLSASLTQRLITEPFKQKSAAQLNEFVDLLNTKNTTNVAIEAFHSYAELKDAMNELIKATSAQLIVMGITGGGKLKETLVGSNSVTVAKSSNIPVMIVPTEAGYKHIGKILLLSDLKDIEQTSPVDAIKNVLDVTKAELYILNVTNNIDKAAESEGKQQLESLLANYTPSFHFMTNSDFGAAVDSFVKDREIDMVIVVPKKQGIFESIFSVNHTKTLAFHSKVPLMAIKH